MILSRLKAAIQPSGGNQPMPVMITPEQKIPKLEEYIAKRDFTGAIALLEVHRIESTHCLSKFISNSSHKAGDRRREGDPRYLPLARLQLLPYGRLQESHGGR